MEVPQPRSIVAIDVRAIGDPDPALLEALVRLQLAAQRCGASIRLHNASAPLVDLLTLAGLADVLPVEIESGLEPDR